MVTMNGWRSLHSYDGHTSHHQSDAISDEVIVKPIVDSETCVGRPVLKMLRSLTLMICSMSLPLNVFCCSPQI